MSTSTTSLGAAQIQMCPTPVGGTGPIAYLLMNKNTGHLYRGSGTGPFMRSIASVTNSAPDKARITYSDSTSEDISLPLNTASAGQPGRGIVSIANDGPNQAKITYSDGTADVLQLPAGADGPPSTVPGPASTIPGAAGRSITSVADAGPGVARVTFSDGATQDLALPAGAAGAPSSVVGPAGAASTVQGAEGRSIASVQELSPGVARFTFSDGGVQDITLPQGVPGAASTVVGPVGAPSTVAGGPGAAGRTIQSIQRSGNELVVTFSDGGTTNLPLPKTSAAPPQLTYGHFPIQTVAINKTTPTVIKLAPDYNQTFTYSSGNTGIMLKANTTYDITVYVGGFGFDIARSFYVYIKNVQLFPRDLNYKIRHTYKTGATDELLQVKALSFTTPSIGAVTPIGFYEILESRA